MLLHNGTVELYCNNADGLVHIKAIIKQNNESSMDGLSASVQFVVGFSFSFFGIRPAKMISHPCACPHTKSISSSD